MLQKRQSTILNKLTSIVMHLTLKRKTAGGKEDQFDLPVVFPKICYLKRG